MNESCHAYERVMSHIWTTHVTHMNESWHSLDSDVYTFIHGSVFIHEYQYKHCRLNICMNKSCYWHMHDSDIYEYSYRNLFSYINTNIYHLEYICHHHAYTISFMCVTRLVYMCDTTRSYV